MRQIHVAQGIVIPGNAISFRAVRSSGPGGQNVNKVSSRVELRVELDRISGLGEAARLRLARLAAKRLDAEGRLVVTSQRTRDQAKNREDAREKIGRLVARAIVAPRRRLATKPSAAARERRLSEKRRRAERKRARGRIAREDD